MESVKAATLSPCGVSSSHKPKKKLIQLGGSSPSHKGGSSTGGISMQGLDIGDGRRQQDMYPSNIPAGIITVDHNMTSLLDTPGIVHQFENTENYSCVRKNNWQNSMFTTCSTSPSFSKHSNLKCPCCRNHNSEILCPSCASNFMRLNKIREARRLAFLRKADICRSIDEQLKAEINFESDFHKKQQLVSKLKSKITDKKEYIQRIKQRISNLELNTSKSSKNVHLLEKKMAAHSDRILRTTAEIDSNRMTAQKAQGSLNKWVFHACSQLLDMFPFQRCDNRHASGGEAWSGQDKQIIYFINHARITEGGSNDHKSYQLLRKQLCNCPSSAMDLCADSQQTFASLVFVSHLTNTLATLLNCTLPYKHLARDLSLTNKWTEELLETVLFKVNYCIIKLCIARGVLVKLLSFHRPFSNLYNLMPMLRAEKMKQPINIAFDSKLRLQIIEEFQKLKWQEQHDFTLDNVEEGDWVAIDFASAK